jgi:hypothetical protein
MATLYEKFITGDDAGAYSDSNRYDAQIFTAATVTHTVSSVKLLIYRDASYAATTIVSIQGVDDSDLPDDNNVLATSDAVAAASIETGAGGTWVEFTFNAPPTVRLGTKYAIVIKPGGSAMYDLRWRYDSANGYAGGTFALRNAGTWVEAGAGAHDGMFEVWGTTDTYIPVDKTYSKELIAIAGDQIFYESVAGTMSILAAASDNINAIDKLNAVVAFQKLFIANGTNLKVFDHVNTKLSTADISSGTNLQPDFGTELTGGSSGAKMLVDYISTINGACLVYGKRTTVVSFISGETVTGTNPAGSPYVGSVSFVLDAAEVAPPHWYNYTVFGGDATNYGTMPDRAYGICRYRGRIQLIRDPNYPHQWYQSRQLNPFDYLFKPGDAQSPVHGNQADCAEVGDIVIVAIPYSDDFLIYGCANELWVMSGDAAYAGELNALDTTTGILGDRAWCWDDKSNLYLMCTTGLLKIPQGFGQIENLTIELWPDFITDLAFDSSLHRITLAFNSEDRGIHISKTTLADGVSSAWWYDLRTEGLFPDSYSADHGVFSAVFYQAEDPDYRKLLFGCNDGYIRFLDRTAKNDDSAAIDSYVGFAPLALSTHPRKDGIIKNIDLVSGGGASGGTYQTDSSDVTCAVHIARTAEQVIEKLRSGTTAAFTKTFSAPGWSKGNLDRRSVRGQWAGVVLRNNTAGESWSMERLIVDTKEIGRSL